MNVCAIEDVQHFLAILCKRGHVVARRCKQSILLADESGCSGGCFSRFLLCNPDGWVSFFVEATSYLMADFGNLPELSARWTTVG
jgi:hypothetical protein